jgi:hypothetical protein
MYVNSVRTSYKTYCQGVCVTNNTGFGLTIRFIGPLCNWLQQFTNYYLTHCHLLQTGHSTGAILTSNWTKLNWTELNWTDKVKVTTQLTVSQSAWPDIYYCLTVTVLYLWGANSDERTGLSFVYAAGPCQRRLSLVWVPRDSRPYFTLSDLRLPFSSPRTSRMVTVEVFDPASTRVTELTNIVGLSLYSLRSDHRTENIRCLALDIWEPTERHRF